MDLGGCIDAIYLDSVKTFDTVSDQRLIKKLTSYSIHEVSVKVDRSHYKESIRKWKSIRVIRSDK